MSRYLIYDSENLKSYQQLYVVGYIDKNNGKVVGNNALSCTSYIRVNEGDTVEIEGTLSLALVLFIMLIKLILVV